MRCRLDISWFIESRGYTVKKLVWVYVFWMYSVYKWFSRYMENPFKGIAQ